MLDKNKEMITELTLVNEKLNFHGLCEGQQPLSIDYIAPLGDNLGYCSLELLLLSLSSCVGSAVLTFLRKMKKTITSFNIQTKGFRKSEHPTAFKKIVLNIQITSSDATDEEIKRVINLAEETYCPVYAMLKGNVDIEINFKLYK